MAYLAVGVTFVLAALVIGLVFYGAFEVATWLGNGNGILTTLWNRAGVVLMFIFVASVLVIVISIVAELAAVGSTYLRVAIGRY
jgi:hypothetical protein